MSASSLEVDQILFGYQRGHRLLASSLPIPPSVEDRLLPLTDAGFRDSIETLSGGEPIDELGAYLLYRSWPASEVKRPGAVWTHGILIGFADLGRITDLGVLVDRLHRPDSEQIESYQQVVTLTIKKPARRRPGTGQVEKRLVGALYGAPEQQVHCHAEDPDNLLGAVTAIWSQQWPRLRRSFRFKSVIEAAPRFLSGIDLVISADTEPLPPSCDDESDENAAWLNTALSDLTGEGGKLRDFLWRYGAEAEGGRAAFRSLVELQAAATTPESPGSLGIQRDLLTSKFPKPNQMIGLKRSLLGPARAPGSELVRLQVLLGSNDNAFDPEELEIAPRAVNLWKENREAALALFTASWKSRGKGVRRVFCSASIPLLRASEIAGLAAESPFLFRDLVASRGEVLATQAFWKALPQEGEKEAVGALRAEVEEDEERRRILAVLVALNREQTIAALHPAWEEATVTGFGLLSRMPHLRRDTLERWIPILEPAEDDLIDWIDALKGEHAPLLATLASFMDPMRAARATAPKLWVPVAELEIPGTVDVDPIEVKAFLLAVGLASNGGAARKLTNASLAPVDRALTKAQLSGRAWGGLERCLPSAKKDWDRPERLRRAFVDAVLAEEWKKGEVLEAVAGNPPLAKRVAALLDRRKKKKGLVQKLWDAVTP